MRLTSPVSLTVHPEREPLLPVRLASFFVNVDGGLVAVNLEGSAPEISLRTVGDDLTPAQLVAIAKDLAVIEEAAERIFDGRAVRFLPRPIF